jgi:hypothetical protein
VRFIFRNFSPVFRDITAENSQELFFKTFPIFTHFWSKNFREQLGLYLLLGPMDQLWSKGQTFRYLVSHMITLYFPVAI